MSLTTGYGNTDFPSIYGDSTDMNVYNLTVENNFSIESIGINNTQLAQLDGINTDETIQQQIDNIVNITNGTGYWGSFWSTNTQNPSATNTPYYAKLNSYDASNNGIILYDASNSDYLSVKVLYSAIYNIQFSIQTSSSTSSKSNIRVWLTKNGTDIPDSAGEQSIDTNDGLFIMTYNIILPLQANDRISLMWAVDNTALHLEALAAITSPYSSPLSPSVIITLQQVQYYQDNSVAVNNLQAEVTDLSSNFYSFESTTNTSLNTINNRLNTLDTSYNLLNTDVQNLTSSYNSFVTTTNNSITSINNSINSINSSISGINSHLSSLDNSVSSINNNINGINNHLNSIDSQISGINAGLAALGATVAADSAAIITIQSQIIGIDADIVAINASLSTIGGQITTLQTKTQNQTAIPGLTTFSGNVSCNAVDTDGVSSTASLTIGAPIINLAGVGQTLNVYGIPFLSYFTSQW